MLIAPTTLGPSSDGGPSTPTKIMPTDLYEVGKRFIGVQADCARIMNDLHNKLWNNTLCIGRDESARMVAKAYASASDTAFAGFVRIHRLLGAIGQALCLSAINHLRADYAAAGKDPGQIGLSPLAPDDEITQMDTPRIDGDKEFWKPDALAEHWPTCDNGKADAIGDAWSVAQEAMDALLTDRINVVKGLLANNTSADLVAFEDYFERLTSGSQTLFPLMVQMLREPRFIIGDYQEKVYEHGQDIRDAVGQALAVVGGTAIVFYSIDAATAGFGALFAGPEGSALAAEAVLTLGPVATAIAGTMAWSQAISHAATSVTSMQVAMSNAKDPKIYSNDGLRIGEGSLEQQTEAEQYQLGVDPAHGNSFNPEEYRIGLDTQEKLGTRLWRSADQKLEWYDANGTSYDAMDCPPEYFDKKIASMGKKGLPQSIVDHLAKADRVPFDVKGSTPDLVATGILS